MTGQDIAFRLKETSRMWTPYHKLQPETESDTTDQNVCCFKVVMVQDRVIISGKLENMWISDCTRPTALIDGIGERH